jgi:hypothetical protein
MDDDSQRAAEQARAARAYPQCSCLDAQFKDQPWHELQLHQEEQDTDCDAWKRLLDLVEHTAESGEKVFAPGLHMPWAELSKIVTLPPSIAKMTRVREMRLYGSNLVRIPPEIGQMLTLSVFDIYTSYRLHWLPFEITHCQFLWNSRISTRALYGNYRFRPPFPRLPQRATDAEPKQCSVCRAELAGQTPIQVWISSNIATDVVPLLVHACSTRCVQHLPKPADKYVQRAHQGGLGLAQPQTDWYQQTNS